MDFIKIKNKFIALNKIRYIDCDVNDDGDYFILFQFEMEDNFTTIYFDDENDYNYWLNYLMEKLRKEEE